MHAPTELININPEGLEVANTFLQLQDVTKVADHLGLEPSMVHQILGRKEIKTYLNQVFFDLGFNNRFTMRQAMDAVLRQKFQELEEGGMGSSKDIAELLSLSHKMTMEYLDKEIQLEKLRSDNKLKTQTNIQINDGGGEGTRYGALIQQLLGGVNA